MYFLRDPKLQKEAETVLRRALGTMLGTAGGTDRERAEAAQNSEWVRLLYANHVATFQGELNRSWGVLRLFIPLSLTPFAAVILAEELQPADVVVLALVSLTLLAAAELFVRRINRFEKMAVAWLVAIQAECGLIVSEENSLSCVPGLRMRQTRGALLLAVGAMWLFLLVAVSLDWVA